MLVGPSYTLSTRKASVQRSVNWMLRAIEPGNEKAGFYLEQCPGLSLFCAMGAEVRGAINCDGRVFVVAGATLYEVYANGTKTSRGTLLTSTGPVDLAWGTTQLVVVDGPYGYTLTLSNNTFARITATAFYGADRVAYLDGFFLFNRPDTQQFYISAIDDAQTLDALDFASAESAPDGLNAVIVDHREVWLLGSQTTEVWFNAGTEFPFQRNQGASMEVGCIAPHSAKQLDNSVFWLDQNGIVRRANGYQPLRVSTHAVEEALAASVDLSQAVGTTYVRDGQSFYVLTVPDLGTTWVYDASVGQWHERAELVAGSYAPIRYRHQVYAFGRNLCGGPDGNLYQMTDGNTLNGSVMARERVTPHSPNPSRDRQFFSSLELDVTVGLTGQSTDPVIELGYSNDGGFTWSNYVPRSLGKVGRYSERVNWSRLGSARDRVWRIRTTSDAKVALIGGAIK